MDSSTETPSAGFGFSSGAGAAAARTANTSHCDMADLLRRWIGENRAGTSAAPESYALRPRREAPTPRLVAPRLHSISQRRPDGPRRELLLADAVDLALGLLAARNRQNLLEDPPADFLHRRPAQNHAGVDVHVVDHVFVHRRVGRHLDRRGRLAAEHR